MTNDRPPFPRPGREMMEARRKVLDAASISVLVPPFDRNRFLRSDVFLPMGTSTSTAITALGAQIDAVAALLRRETGGSGYCVLRRMPDAPIDALRSMHQELFAAVWNRVRRLHRCDPQRSFRVGSSLTRDGRIPIELHGSTWSFKPPHADRDAVVFSHLFGPLSSFTGGDVHVVDSLAYLHAESLSFDEAFTWSDEGAVSKPVLRAEHRANALRGFGRNLGRLGPREILFVNNAPSCGVLHGASEVHVADPRTYQRHLHRCFSREEVKGRPGAERSGGMSGVE